MAKIKILFLYSAKGFAGLTRNLSILISNLDSERFDVSVAFIGEPEDQAADLRFAPGSNFSSDIRFIKMDERGKFSLTLFSELRDFVKRESFEILSCHGYKAKFYAVLLGLSLCFPFKLVSVAHGWGVAGRKVQLYYALDKLLLHLCDKVVLVSEGQRQQLQGFLIPPRKLLVISNGVDSRNLVEQIRLSDLRAALSLDDGTLLVGMLSRLSEEKDIQTALLGFSYLLDECEDAFLVIAGEGPSEKALLDYSRELGIENQVSFIGFESEVPTFLSQLDVFVSTSLQEGMPNSVLEAQALGLPCVVTRISGHLDLVLDGETGYLFEEGNPRELANALCPLLQNERLREDIGQQAREHIQQHFSVQQRVAKFEKLYSELSN
jgi:glycosyltransferase involved in cell wall biosynthesis